MLEVEIKAHCGDIAKLERELAALGATSAGARREVDCYFNHPARDFRITDEAFRMRRVGEETIVTYKGPKLGTRAKSREEIEVTVADFETMRTILQKLGFVESGFVTKERVLYHLGEVEICVDRVEGLGVYVELELRAEEREKAEAELFALAAKLGLETFERRSYLELLGLR